jgi:hypothetical protein
MKYEPTGRYFFRHLRNGNDLRKHPLTLLALGAAAQILPDALLVRTLHDRLRELVSQVYARPTFARNAARAQRLKQIFERHLLRGDHWSSLAAELSISRRQFFRERRALCDELGALLQLDPQHSAPAVAVQLTREQLAYNEAFLAFEAGNLESALRTITDLCVWLPPGELRSRAFVLAAECAVDRLRFEDASSNCALASNATAGIENSDDRAIGAARVHLTRSRCHLYLSDYRNADLQVKSATRGLSRVSLSDERRSEQMKALSVRAAEIAIHIGAFDAALEQVSWLRYSTNPNDAASEFSFDLASLEAAIEVVAGRFQNALQSLEEARLRAERLKFNRQVVRFHIEHAWAAIHVDVSSRALLAQHLAMLAQAVRIPYLALECWLFSAANDAPAAALEHSAKARRMSPPSSMLAARAVLAQAVAAHRLGRTADAFDLAAELEHLAERLDNNRLRAWSLMLMAKIRLTTYDRKRAAGLKRDAEEFLRLYGTASERNAFAQSIQAM